jgi:uncharacterized repeat protein (TIGR03899 family)
MTEETKSDAPLVEVSGVNLKGWEKSVEKLIETLGAGAATLYEPTAIRERAKAASDAAVTIAETQLHILDLEQRARHRRDDLELRRQKNLESIAQQSVPELPDRVSDDPVEQDWVYQFMNHAQDVGSSEMQRVWGKILAREVTKPGSFSLRALRTVADLNSRDAHRFTQFCSFVWHSWMGERSVFAVVFDLNNPTISDLVSYDDFLHLDALGLIRMSELQTYSTALSGTRVHYYDRSFTLSGFPPAKVGLEVGKVVLTAVGAELEEIAGGRANSAYCDDVVKQWETRYKLTVTPLSS